MDTVWSGCTATYIIKQIRDASDSFDRHTHVASCTVLGCAMMLPCESMVRVDFV